MAFPWVTLQDRFDCISFYNKFALCFCSFFFFFFFHLFFFLQVRVYNDAKLLLSYIFVVSKICMRLSSGCEYIFCHGTYLLKMVCSRYIKCPHVTRIDFL